MPAIMAVSLRLPAELGERLYAAVPAGQRNAWLVRAVEQALGETKESFAREQADPGLRSPGEGRSAAPAEQSGEPMTVEKVDGILERVAERSSPVGLSRPAARSHAPNCKCPVCS